MSNLTNLLYLSTITYQLQIAFYSIDPNFNVSYCRDLKYLISMTFMIYKLDLYHLSTCYIPFLVLRKDYILYVIATLHGI